jgi:hypothetical protein
MKEYNYSDIVKFDEKGILFSDSMYIEFEKCKYEWAKENNISVADTACVAQRFSEGNIRCFIFYSKEKIKLNFVFCGIFKHKKCRDKFCEMQILLNRYGYTSYDMS